MYFEMKLKNIVVFIKIQSTPAISNSQGSPVNPLEFDAREGRRVLFEIARVRDSGSRLYILLKSKIP